MDNQDPSIPKQQIGKESDNHNKKSKLSYPDQHFLNNSQRLLQHLISLKIANVKKNPFIFLSAFIHSSYLNENKSNFFSQLKDYERLEFMGDSILNHLVSEYIFINYVNLNEGELSKLRSKLIQKQTLIKASKNLRLNEFIFLGYGEIKKINKFSSKIFSDVFEALTGAVFLTSGISGTRSFLENYFFPMINKLLIETNNEYLEDYKTKLQEFFHRFKDVKVKYTTKTVNNFILDDASNSKKKFFMTSIIVNDEVVASAFDLSKKLSEKKAAEKAYHKLSNDLDFIKNIKTKN
ncbi:ribonuclease III [Mycoplasma sp. SG1]|uniref:ribonuclease III n=1 Tax=Mycoplasma sp. SG1 TaxID=2810348 RepID=UPI0020242E1F|nr:ribonuclease III [Mycoplasma sp. SG1]URM53201.1 ribonuclease III [Mycoplasma sp. SG1]